MSELFITRESALRSAQISARKLRLTKRFSYEQDRIITESRKQSRARASHYAGT